MNRLCRGLVILFFIPTALCFMRSGRAEAARKYSVKIYDLPTAAGQDCDDLAATLGSKFAETYKVAVIEAFCDIPDEESLPLAIVITYESSSPLSEISTLTKSTAIASSELYTSEADCSAALAGELPYFQRKTGLVPFVSFCRPPFVSMSSTKRWSLVIIAFGDTAIQPYIGAYHYYGKLIGMDREEFEGMLKKGFAAFQAEIAHWVSIPNIGYGSLNVRYYGPRPVRFFEEPLAKFNDPRECLEQHAAVDAAMAQTPQLSLGTYCQQVTGPGSEVEMVSLITAENSLRIVKPTVQYSSFSTCKSNLETVIQRYRVELGRPIIVGICAWDQSRKAYVSRLLEKAPD